MKTINKFHALLALLIMGSATALAQTGDPFPEVSTKYSESMTIFGKVYLDGEVLGNETIIAVYHGNEIRGKNTPFDQGSIKNLFSINVYGETNGEPLYFRVYTGGAIYEVDQGLTFTVNEVIGSPNDPYIVNLPSALLLTPPVEGWAAVCLPFNTKAPLGTTLWFVTGVENEKLVLQKVEGNVLPAGTPVLVQTEGSDDIVWTKAVTEPDINPEGNILKGVTEDTEVETGEAFTFRANKDGDLGFWLFKGTTIPAYSAYLPKDALESFGAYLDESMVVGIISIDDVEGERGNNCYYFDLAGRNRSQLQKGINIMRFKDGTTKKVLVK